MPHPILERLTGQHPVNRPVIGLAPMAGVTDIAFRQICEQLGADYSVCEMVASKPELLQTPKSQSRLHFTDHATPNIIQIVGNQPDEMAMATTHYIKQGAEIIDINLGCPAKKVNGTGAGSALLQSLDKVEAILRAVTAVSTVPVTLKTRLGWDHDNYTLLDIVQIAEQVGISLITVHGRTRACRFNGNAQYDLIGQAKAATRLPMIVNGDIDSVEKAQQVLQQTQCDGIMVGRASLGNPWLFHMIRRELDCHFTAHDSAIDKIQLACKHIAHTQQLYGGITGVRYARKHIQKYLQHLTGTPDLFKNIASIDNAEAQLDVFAALLEDYA